MELTVKIQTGKHALSFHVFKKKLQLHTINGYMDSVFVFKTVDLILHVKGHYTHREDGYMHTS